MEFRWLKQAVRPGKSLESMLERRRRNEPLSYIIGSHPFGPLNLRIRPPVLIPRTETEDWVIRLAASFPHPSNTRSLLDLGTGSGCIPLLLSHLLPQRSLTSTGIDISPHAITLANENAAFCGYSPTSNGGLKNTFTAHLANFMAPSFPDVHLPQPPFDILTSNPPYISWNEYLALPPSVSEYEDPKALFGGPSGLMFYHAIARLITRPGFLSSDAIVALEVGHEQAQSVQDILRNEAGLSNSEIWHDPWGKPRTVVARV